MRNEFVIPDGNEALRGDIPVVVELIERTALWVNPETFRRLPVWAPYMARGRSLYNAEWNRRYTNTRKATGVTAEKVEGNVAALKALQAALGVTNPRPKNWTVCHIWGYDDSSYAQRSEVVQDPRYYSCLANMIWLPTPLKGFTDALPEVKDMLRVCAFQLYGWACDHPAVAEKSARVRSGWVPDGYPRTWPAPERPNVLPQGTAPLTGCIEEKIAKQKQRIKNLIEDRGLKHFPRDEVLEVLKFWGVQLDH